MNDAATPVTGWKEPSPTYQYATLARVSGTPLAALALGVMLAWIAKLPLAGVALAVYLGAILIFGGIFLYELRDVRVGADALTLRRGLGYFAPSSVAFSNIARVQFAVTPRVAMVVLEPRTLGSIPSGAAMIAVPKGKLSAVRDLFAARGIPATDSLAATRGPLVLGMALGITAMLGVAALVPQVFPHSHLGFRWAQP